MTPVALRMLRALRSLDLPTKVLRKIGVRSDGKPIFTRLSDPEFDEVMVQLRKAIPARFWKTDPAPDLLHESLPGMKASGTTH